MKKRLSRGYFGQHLLCYYICLLVAMAHIERCTLYLHAHCRLVQDHAASTARKNCRGFTVLLDNSQLLVLAPPLLWENHDDNSDEMSTASRMNEPNYMIELH